MSALVIGASGLVGGALLGELRRTGAAAVGTYHRTPQPGLVALDITDAAALAQVFGAARPSVVYLAAAQTNVDWCESHAAESEQINVAGTAAVADACARVGARLVFFSSDYVFDGRSGPYSEDDQPAPINVYGHHKLAAERLVLADPTALVVRTTVVFGPERQRKNFAYRVQAVLGRREQLRVPIDQRGSPSYAPAVARLSVALVGANATGIYHVAGPVLISRYQFAVRLAAALGLPADLIAPITTAELGQPARRPLQAGLYTDKASHLLGQSHEPLAVALADFTARM